MCELHDSMEMGSGPAGDLGLGSVSLVLSGLLQAMVELHIRFSNGLLGHEVRGRGKVGTIS